MNAYEMVTERIIEKLEQGTIPWRKPWSGVANYAISHNGNVYSILNQMLLDCEGEWITFNAAKKAGGSIKKGAKSKVVVFWNMIATDRKDNEGNVMLGEDGKPLKKMIPMLKTYNVFDVNNQCENVKPIRKIEELNENIDPIANADELIASYIERSGVKLTEKLTNQAYYMPSADSVNVPDKKQYKNVNEFYSTVFHELVHSTGAKNRLNRFQSGGFGSEAYSQEELVAEIGTAMILNILGIEVESTFENSAAYIQGWLSKLRNDSKLIVTAATRAEKAVKLIFGELDTNEQAMNEAA